MKVNINNQEVPDEPDNSYLSNAGIVSTQLNRQLQQPPKQRNETDLQQSIKQNNKKVTGASSIRTLIKSAATRD